MMDDLQDLERRLLNGPQGEALRSLADSDEARRLGEKLSPAEAEAALRSGDEARMRALLQKLLSTGDGRALAEKLAGLGKNP